MSHRLAYLICATPRSGTTMLCDLMRASGQAGRPESYYRQQDIDRRAAAWGLRVDGFFDEDEFNRAYLRAVLHEGAGETGVFGLRIMWKTVGELFDRLGPLYASRSAEQLFKTIFGPLVYVHVSRKDKLAQAISLLKAERSGLWHLAADGSVRQGTTAQVTLFYDARRIHELLTELEREDAAWDDFFAKHAIEPVRVQYEALAARPREEVGGILAALGLEPALAEGLAVQTSPMADAQSLQWAERFRREQADTLRA